MTNHFALYGNLRSRFTYKVGLLLPGHGGSRRV
jgi:hypothetical protein